MAKKILKKKATKVTKKDSVMVQNQKPIVIIGTNNPNRKFAPVLVLLLVLTVIQLLFVFPLLLIHFVQLYIFRPELALGLLLVQVLIFLFLIATTVYTWCRYRNI
jgi:hypothetical protein